VKYLKAKFLHSTSMIFCGFIGISPCGGSGVPFSGALSDLSLASVTYTINVPISVAVNGVTFGSSVAATASDGTSLTVTSGIMTGTFTTAGSKLITLVETLAGASNSPRTSGPILVTVNNPAAPPSSGSNFIMGF